MQETRPTAVCLPAVEASNLALLAKLLKFYGVTTIEDLVWAQVHHIDKLQQRLATKDSFTRTYGGIRC